MTTLSHIPRPQAERFEGKRSLFLVPNYVAPPGLPEEGQTLVERYWSDVRDAISNLERSLGAVRKVYHEMVSADGDDGLQQIEAVNPSASALIRAMCQSTAEMRGLEDAELVAEHFDWYRMQMMGPSSQAVLTAAIEGYQRTLDERFSNIAERIGSDLGEGESAALFIREDHRVQFGGDVQVFYIAPPSLDALKRWLDGHFREGSGESAPSPIEEEGV